MDFWVHNLLPYLAQAKEGYFKKVVDKTNISSELWQCSTDKQTTTLKEFLQFILMP